MSEISEDKGPEYPTEAHGSIPAFNNYEEEAEFWDTHEFSEFWYEAKPVELHVAEHLSEYSLSKKVEVRFDEETDQELATQAKERGVKKSALIRAVMKEWLRQSHEHQAS